MQLDRSGAYSLIETTQGGKISAPNLRMKSSDKGQTGKRPVKAEKPLNKNELRTRSTQQQLLQAAEDVFARDGFEKAELGEIAKRAGRTKGSIYAHFKNKEDLFLAIVKHRTTQYQEEFRERLSHVVGSKEKLRVFREFFGEIIGDRHYWILSLEFKLYAIRNPRSKKKLQQLYREWYPLDERHYTELLGAAPDPSLGLPSRVAAGITFATLLSAVTVEKEFAPAIFDEETVEKLVSRVFDSLLRPGQD
jgi:AcrR family transcriptional regulator